MKTKNQSLISDLKSRIDRGGDSFQKVLADAEAIYVFGSRAAGVHNDKSDLDVLCFGRGDRIKNRYLDLLWVPPHSLDVWLSSELASHVAEYGICIRGSFGQISNAVLGEEALAHKRARIRRLVSHAAEGWPRLHMLFRRRYQITIRRELQRFSLLTARTPIPPTPLLDEHWSNARSSPVDLIESFGLDADSGLLLNLLSSDVRVSKFPTKLFVAEGISSVP